MRGRNNTKLPSRGSQLFGSILFQYWLCSRETNQTVSVADSLAVMGPNSSGGCPRRTLDTAKADRDIDVRLYPPCVIHWSLQVETQRGLTVPQVQLPNALQLSQQAYGSYGRILRGKRDIRQVRPLLPHRNLQKLHMPRN